MAPATQSVACIARWFDTFGIPDPAPLPRGNYTNEVQFSMRAFLESLWDPVEQRWWTSKGGPELLSRKALPAHYAFQLRMGAILTTNSQLQNQYLDRAALAEQLGGFRPAWDDLGLIWANPVAGLMGWRGQAAAHLDTMWPDGSWRFRTRIETDGVFKGKDYSLLGPDKAAEIGTCAQKAYEVLRLARVTGDAELFDAVKKSLAFMDQFTVPRAAQVWECPVHAPDVLAAADAIDAYLEAYRYSGDHHYLDQAIAWAWRGLPFIYVWNPPGRPILRYASIPIFGGSWFEGSWIGQPVQWNGLRYAYALLKLADYQSAFPWKKIAEGITRSAIHQQDTAGANVALWPDNFSALDWSKCPWVFEPGMIMKNVFKLLDRDIEPGTAVVDAGNQRAFITSRATISAGAWQEDRLIFQASFPPGESGAIIVARLWKPAAVLHNDSLLPEAQGDLSKVLSNAWHYSAEPGVVAIKLLASGPHNLEIRGAKSRPGTLIPRTATTIEFDFDSDFGGWRPVNQITDLSQDNGLLKGIATGGDPYLHRDRMRLDGSRCSRIAVRAKASAGSGIAIYWITQESPAWAEDKVIHLRLRPGNNFNLYLFELGKHPLWATQTITGIRLDPLEGGSGGTFEIDFIRGNAPRLLASHFLGEKFTFFLQGIPTLEYQVESSTNLSDWRPLFQVVPESVSSQIDDPEARFFPARFYRALVMP
jgi:hypothetical protein